jgi:hypothetical protein
MREEYDKALRDAIERNETYKTVSRAESLVKSESELKQEAKETALENVQSLMEQHGNKGRLQIDTELSNIGTGGLVLYDTLDKKATIAFHGAESGAIDPETNEPIGKSAEEVNAKDIQSYKDSLLRPFKGDQTPIHYAGINDQAQAVKEKYSNVETASYSNGGLKALYLNKTEGISGTTFDPVLGGVQTRDIVKGTHESMKYVRTNLPALAMGMGQTVAQAVNPQSIDITTTQAVEGVKSYELNTAHSLSPYLVPDSRLAPIKPTTYSDRLGEGLKATAKGTPQSLLTGYLAGQITNALDPQHQLGQQADLLATAGTNLALDAGIGGIGTALVTGSLESGLASAGEGIAGGALPTFAAYEVGSFVNNAVNNATQNWSNRTAAHAVSGAATGASALGTAGLTQGAVSAGTQALSTATTTATTATAAAAETGGEITAAGIASGAGEVAVDAGAAALAEGLLNPVADAVAVGAGVVALGASIGAFLGSIFG